MLCDKTVTPLERYATALYKRDMGLGCKSFLDFSNSEALLEFLF